MDLDILMERETVDIETNLISSLIADTTLLNDLKINEKYFISSINKKICNVIRRLLKDEEEINPITIADRLKGEIQLSKVLELQSNGEIYKNMFQTLQSKIINQYNKRLCLEVSQGINKRIADGEDPTEVFRYINKNITENTIVKDEGCSITEVLESTMDKIETAYKNRSRITGMKTGYKQLDSVLNGIEKKKYIIIGARPGVGKTAFSIELAKRLATSNKVLYFSLEMAQEELGERLISNVNKIQNQKVRTGWLSENELEVMMKGISKLTQLDLTIDDSEDLSVEELSRRSIRHKNKNGLDVIIVDYLTLLNTEERFINTREQVNYISSKLRILSKKLDVAVICLAQLNRAVEGRSDKVPTIADLRETGNIEQDANSILLLHSQDKDGTNNDFNIIVGKNRGGQAHITICFNYYKQTQIIEEKYV